MQKIHNLNLSFQEPVLQELVLQELALPVSLPASTVSSLELGISDANLPLNESLCV